MLDLLMHMYPIYAPHFSGKPLADPLPPEVRVVNPDGLGELIMVVDDDDAVRMLVEFMLAQEGYRIVSAATGKEALVLIEKLKNRVDLVILDFVMPGMDCAQTLRGLRDVVSNLPIIIISGYTSNETLEQLVIDSNSGFIPKPLGRKKLSHGIDTALGEVRAG
jgi:CheY-like chemotaxis protein